MEFYVDGSGWNGTNSRACVVWGNRELVFTIREKKTNNEMEYEALILALILAKEGDVILTDSQLVINQIEGNWSVNYPHLQSYVNIIRQRLQGVDVEIKWVPREGNRAGKLLERK